MHKHCRQCTHMHINVYKHVYPCGQVVKMHIIKLQCLFLAGDHLLHVTPLSLQRFPVCLYTVYHQIKAKKSRNIYKFTCY